MILPTVCPWTFTTGRGDVVALRSDGLAAGACSIRIHCLAGSAGCIDWGCAYAAALAVTEVIDIVSIPCLGLVGVAGSVAKLGFLTEFKNMDISNSTTCRFHYSPKANFATELLEEVIAERVEMREFAEEIIAGDLCLDESPRVG